LKYVVVAESGLITYPTPPREPPVTGSLSQPTGERYGLKNRKVLMANREGLRRDN
jgi:hypothetical protein